MATVPKFPYREKPRGRERTKMKVVKPLGRFVREKAERRKTDRNPGSVTHINPKDMEPILPEMIYIPPT